MFFSDAPLSDKKIGQYIAAKIATKRRTLTKLPHTLRDLAANRVLSNLRVPGAAPDNEVRSLVYDDEVTAAIKLEIYEGFFNDLAILDQKAGALSQVIAIITAFIVLLFDGKTGVALPGLVAVAFCAAMIALILTISVLTVRWSTTVQMEDRTQENMLLSICWVRNWRTIRFRVALYLSFFSLLIVSAYIVSDRMAVGFAF